MKKESIFKKILVGSGYLLLALVLTILIFILIVNSSSKENDSIVKAQDSESYFRNINPKFVVDFIDNEYIRFETVSSFSNPFEGEKQTFWEKIRYTLGLKQKKLGIEISLEDVSYDKDITDIFNNEDIDIPKYSLEKNFKLTSSGREIGENDKEAISKDTVISESIYKGVDIEYQVIKGKGLKEEIILNEIPEYETECSTGKCSLPVNRFLFKLKLDEGLEFKRSVEGNEQYPSGTYYITDIDNNYFAHFLPEFAVDSVGNKTSSVETNISESEEGIYMFEVILDSEWLLSNERVFPIRIDPSVVHDTDLIFNQGIYDRVELDPSLMISLKSADFKSGVYTSGLVDIGENSKLRNISWESFGVATGDGELPFSRIGLILEENFNDIQSVKKKWGTGALNTNKNFDIPSSSSNFFTVEFWSYSFNLKDIEQTLAQSNLVKLNSEGGKYTLIDSLGNKYLTEIPVNFNSWEYIGLVFDMVGSKVTLYIDESEFVTDIDMNGNTKLSNISLGGSLGYFDTLRVYDRLLARNELVSNSQYSNIYLQYISSLDNVTWSDWSTKLKYISNPVVEQGSLDITSETEDLSSYDLLSLKFLLEEESKVVLGESKFLNGIDNENVKTLEGVEGVIDGTQTFKYIDFVYTPTEYVDSCLINIGDLSITSKDTVTVKIGQDILTLTNPHGELILNEPNYISISMTGSEISLYVNGEMYSKQSSTYTLTPTQYQIGKGCIGTEAESVQVSNVRVSTTDITVEDIVRYSEIADRTYTLKPSFVAMLQGDTEILDSSDTQFSITEMPFGSTNYIANLSIGDSIVVMQAEYLAEGKVLSLSMDTGLVEVESWKEGSTFPTTGFGLNASVLKWQEEYIPTDVFLNRFVPNYVINMKSDVISSLRNIELISIYRQNEEVPFSNNDIYMKYRFIYTTSKYGISSNLSNVTVNFDTSGPNMDQVLRHGQWFNNEGVKQSFWWAK